MVDGVGTTHHVKIGSHHYLVRPGSYRKTPAPLFGPRFSTGDPDYNNLSAWQHWAQTCWIGGFGAVDWEDDSMYDEVAGIDSTQHEVLALTRDMTFTSALEGSEEIRRFCVFNNILYCLSFGPPGTVGGETPASPSYLWRLNDSDNTWTEVHEFTYACRDLVVFGDKLFIADGGPTTTYMNSDETFSNFAKPGSMETIPDALGVYREHLYVAFNREIWRLTEDLEWDGSTVFYETPGGDWVNNMEVHLGFLYFSTNNGWIFRSDGNNTFEMWHFEGSGRIIDLRSFDGKLFIGCDENQLHNRGYEGVLYQFSGSAVTELKRWGRLDSDIHGGQMRIFGNRLWFGAPSLLGMADGFGIATYDPIEDGFHMWATQRDGVTYAPGTRDRKWHVDDVFFFKGQFWASVRGHGVFRSKYSFRDLTRFNAEYDTTAAGASTAAGNGGWYTSSDFDAGTPGLLKLWNAITVHVDLPTEDTSIAVEISNDGGVTYRSAGVLAGDGTQTRYAHTFILDDGEATPGPLKATRIKYRIYLRTTDTTRSPQLRGVIVRYLPIPEPNWRWSMTLVLSEDQELLDGSSQEPNNVTKLAALRSAFRASDLVSFTEPDGTQWEATGAAGVLILDMQEHLPLIGPTSDGALEHEIPITLLEMVEQYES